MLPEVVTAGSRVAKTGVAEQRDPCSILRINEQKNVTAYMGGVIGGNQMTKVSIAEFKRQINGKRARFVARGVVDQIPFDKISEILEAPQDLPYSTITFNTVDMLRTMEDGETSHCSLKGIKAFISDKGFVLVSPWGARVNVMVYQF